MSYSNTGAYGQATIYKEFPDGRKAGRDENYGLSNTDQGQQTVDNAYWNPHNSAKFIANLYIPEKFGPRLFSLHPFGDWNINWYTTWNQGFRYTYHSPGDFSTVPLNRRWFPMWNTNLKLAKGFRLTSELRVEFNIRVINLFNKNRLRLPGNEFMEFYHEEGRLPFEILGYDEFREEVDNVWLWYDFAQMPREIIFGLNFEF
jgi:hypothetical protein